MWGLFSQIQPWCRFTAATSLGWPKELWACTAETWSVFLLRGSQPDFRCFVTTGAESEHPVLVVLPAGGLQRRCKTHLLSSFSELVGPVYICTQQEKCVFRDMGPLNNTHLSFLSSTQAHLSNCSDQFCSAGQPSGQSVQHGDRLYKALVGLTLLHVLPLWWGHLQETTRAHYSRHTSVPISHGCVGHLKWGIFRKH